MTKFILKFNTMYHLYEKSVPRCLGNTYTNKNINLSLTYHVKVQKNSSF